MSDLSNPSQSIEEKYSVEQITGAFVKEGLEKKKLSLSYKLAIFVSTIVMIILPLIYLGIIVGIAYYAYDYWTNTYANLRSFQKEPFFPAVLTVMSAILCIFMVKPIFAKMPKHAKNLVVEPGSEPALEKLIKEICLRLNAPYPSEICLSGDVNASASLRNGLWSLLKNDLRLTIGIPLIQGLKTQELTEVLAHEFGHFAQGVGMKSTYITRSVNFWFLRVVYQRDKFDVWLDKATNSMPDIRLTVFFWAMQLLIWCTRAILRVLMWIGQAVSCLTLRQMEYDADHHAARIVGSDVFVKTSRRMNALMIGQQIGYNTVKAMWMEKLLPERLSRLTCVETKSIDKEKLDEFIDGQAKEAKAKLFDTHPTDAERSKAVEKLSLPGVFHLSGEASQLVLNADLYDAEATRAFYVVECEFDLKDCELLESEEMDQRHKAAKSRGESMEKWFHNAIGVLCPIPVSAWAYPKFISEESSRESIARLSEEVEGLTKPLELELEALNKANTDLLRGYIVNDCHRAGLKLNKGSFDMKNPSQANAIALQTESNSRLTSSLVKVNEMQHVLVKRLMHSLVLKSEQHPEVVKEVNELVAFIYHLTPFITELNKLNIKVTPLIQIIHAVGDNEIEQTSIDWIKNQAGAIKADLSGLWGKAEGITYPLNKERKSLQELAFASTGENASDPFRAVSDADELVDRIHQFYVDSLAQLAVLAEVGE